MKTDDPVSTRQINTERIRVFMESAKTATKSQMARELGLSFPTITRLADELCSSGELMEQGTGSSTGGRCASCYKLNPLYRLYLLIQLDSSGMYWNLKDLEQNTVEQGELHFPSLCLENVDAVIVDIAQRYQHLNSIAVGMATLISNGVVDESAGLLYLRGIDIREHFLSVTTLPIVIENDMNFLTAGCWIKRRPSVNSLVTLYFNGCGMGGGMVIDGKLWTGASGYCSEASFLPFLEHYWEDLQTNPQDTDICELYARIIQIHAVTVNPAAVILYDHPLLSNKLDEIRRRCSAYIPPKAIPSIELSRSYQEDYEKGLFVMARKEGNL